MICVLSGLEADQKGEVTRRVGGVVVKGISGQIYIFPLREAVGCLCRWWVVYTLGENVALSSIIVSLSGIFLDTQCTC